jgi:ATP-dependent exoDNAse (exonuclease V) beta subunit
MQRVDCAQTHATQRETGVKLPAHQEGHAWGDMALLCRHHQDMYLCANVLNRRGLPYQMRDKAGQFDPAADTIKLMTLHASKGLEFPVVALVGAGHMPAPGEDEREEAEAYLVPAPYFERLMQHLKDLEDAQLARERANGPFVEVNPQDL